MKTMHAGFLLTLLCCVNALPGGNPDSLGLGGVYVRINAPRAAVLESLGDKCSLNQLGGPDQWGVISKDSVPRSLGLVVFDSAKVAYVAKDWGSYGDESARAFSSLCDLLSGMGKAGKGSAKLSVSESSRGDQPVRTLTIGFGKREIRLNIRQAAGGLPPSVGIEEVLKK
jgi:hypothetical protein